MYVVEVLLPVFDNEGFPFDTSRFAKVQARLIQKFGGLTSFKRTPVQGFMKHAGTVTYDEIIVIEIMTEELDRIWWHLYRKTLQRDFRQEEIVVRASQVTKL